MKQEIKKMEELIQEYLGMVKTYPEKPAYYLQVNKTGCRLLVRVNDIPVGGVLPLADFFFPDSLYL